MVSKFCPVDPKDPRVDELSGHVFSNFGILLLIKRSCTKAVPASIVTVSSDMFWITV